METSMSGSTSFKKDAVNSQKLSSEYPTEVPNEMIEEQAMKVPNLVFLGLAGASIIGSAYLTFGLNKKVLGNFVGLWVPTILLFGVYNKIVKVEDEILKGHV